MDFSVAQERMYGALCAWRIHCIAWRVRAHPKIRTLDLTCRSVHSELQEKSAHINGRLRKFIAVDNFAVVKIGDLEKETKCMNVVPRAVVREGAGELTLRAHEEGVVRSFIDTTNVGNKRWVPSLVDDDWHALCQDIHKGIKGPEWRTMFYPHKELDQAVKSKKSGEHKKAKVLWVLKEAKAKRVDLYDGSNEKRRSKRDPG